MALGSLGQCLWNSTGTTNQEHHRDCRIIIQEENGLHFNRLIRLKSSPLTLPSDWYKACYNVIWLSSNHYNNQPRKIFWIKMTPQQCSLGLTGVLRVLILIKKDGLEGQHLVFVEYISWGFDDYNYWNHYRSAMTICPGRFMLQASRNVATLIC